MGGGQAGVFGRRERLNKLAQALLVRGGQVDEAHAISEPGLQADNLPPQVELAFSQP